MYGYAGQSAAATKVPSFATPPQTTNSSAQTGQTAAVTQATSTSATADVRATLSQAARSLSLTLHSLSTPGTSTNSSTSILNPNSNFWNTVTSSGTFNPSQIVTACTASTLGSTGASSIVGGGALDGFATLTSSYGAGAQGFSVLGGTGTSMTAGLGQAVSIGHLSAPPAWAATAPPAAPLSSVAATGPISAPAQAASGMPGIAPPATLAERARLYAALPDNRFLERPPMVPRWPSTG